MLYGTNASKASGDSHDRDYDPAPIPGLAAISPLRRPAVVTSGGSIGVQGTGGGGAGAGETPVQGSRARSFSINPADRSTLIRSFAAQPTPKARQAFAKSGRGSKESPMSPGSWATPAGLSGLDGLDGVFGWIKQRVTPGRQVKKIVRYTGAAVVAPFVSAGTTRKVFGLSPKESSQFETGAKVTRAVAITAATLGAAKYAYGLKAASSASAIGGYAPAASPLAVSYAPAAPVFAANTAGYATPAMFGGTGTVFSGGSYVPASASLFAASSSISPAVSAGVPLSGSSALIASPASISGGAAPVVKSGYLASTGKALISGVGQVAKAVGIQVGAQAILSSLQKQPQAEAAQDYYAGEFGATPTELPAFSMPTGGSYGGGGGGESSGGESPILAGVSPYIGLGLAGAAIVLYLSRRKA